MGRTAAGVRGISLASDKDYVVEMVAITRENANLLVVSEKGYGKRSDIEDYRITKRGGKGVKTLNVTEKTGELVSIKEVIDTDDLMIINKSGITIRLEVDSLRVMGRATQGVKLIKVGDNDSISSVEKIEKLEGEDEEIIDGEESTDNDAGEKTQEQ
jgi:DNA gyrase subunit A